VRDAGQNLKQRNRALYYGIKRTLIVLIFALIIIPSVLM
jgi:beta-hydroxylase